MAGDDDAIINSTTLMLEIMGYTVDRTLDDNPGLAIANKRPDLVLLNFELLSPESIDICRQIKTNRATKPVFIFVIFANRDIEHSVLENGADDFLEKPFEMATLLNKVIMLIG